ncbi:MULTISPECIES: tetratricopeptide repeat protein [Flavobacteriaceae]|uniref:tetratricopeptide repeat protein n=1 Tax=Flavobacteriaceae TaxID=49546 RepID=UPI00234B59E1|nr:tetratricopeptide repeat protein [Muricauda sp. SP22]MDC6364022.1 tetratricopeptide repeat protein [Muricauda sp. SP22]
MDWYDNQDWDEDMKMAFEEKLKRSRGSFNKAQYLRIKGSNLINSEDNSKQKAGINLLERVTEEYSTELFHSYFAHEQLGDYYFQKKEYQKAIQHYQEVVNYYQNSRNGTSGIADIKFAEAIVNLNKRDRFLEAVRLLTDDFIKTGGSLDFKDDIFRYHFVLARLYEGISEISIAKEHAKRAYDVYQSKEVQFPKHPKLGMITVSEDEYNNLVRLVN